MKSTVAGTAFLAIALCCAATSTSTSTSTIIHVDASAGGANDGSSWDNAFTDLHDALALADDMGGEGIQIWVAAGTYLPSPGETDPQRPYTLVSGTAIYGCFAGWESELHQRDCEANETVLRRETLPFIDGRSPILVGEVLQHGSILDGFIVRDGRNWAPPSGGGPGGLWLVDSSIHIANCSFINNETSDPPGGGGIRASNSTLVITNCKFIDNHADAVEDGGAMYLEQSRLLAADCMFTGNRAAGAGCVRADGGEIEFTDCIFRENSAAIVSPTIIAGGQARVMLKRCDIRDNRGNYAMLGSAHLTMIDSSFVNNSGGIDWSASDATVEIINCAFIGNDCNDPTCGEGGAALLRASKVYIRDSLFDGNGAPFSGGQLWLGEAVLENCIIINGRSPYDAGIGMNGGGPLKMINCLIAGNRNSGIGLRTGATGSTAEIINCTIIGNTWFVGAPPPQAGLHVGAGSHATVHNSIIWGNRPMHLPGSRENDFGGFTMTELPEHYQIVGSVDVSHSIIQGLNPDGPYAGPGVIGYDPKLADGYGRLSPGSPAIDAGLNRFLPPEIELDLDGNPRIVDGGGGNGRPVVDMGAYEFQPHLLGDLNGDGVIDVSDLHILLAAWGSCLPTNTTCPADLTGDGTTDVSDLLILLSNWS